MRCECRKSKVKCTGENIGGRIEVKFVLKEVDSFKYQGGIVAAIGKGDE